jgi:very-short-patch-repair endonuclease
VAVIAADQWGVLSVGELRACGLSEIAIRVRVACGRLHPVHRGVYAVGHPGLSTVGRFLAAVKACGPNAVLSHVAAAVMWGFVEDDECVPEVTVTGAATRVHRGIRVHRTASLAQHEWLRFDGVPITSPLRTLLDLAAVVDEKTLRRAVRRAQGLRRVTVRRLAEGLRRAGPRRGTRRLARIIATGPAPTRSELENVVLDLLLDGGFAHPDVNRPLRFDGRRMIPDFRWPAERIVVEADGGAWHDSPDARREDAERQALLEANGERVLRVTWHQAVARPAQTLARLRAAGVPPRPSS